VTRCAHHFTTTCLNLLPHALALRYHTLRSFAAPQHLPYHTCTASSSAQHLPLPAAAYRALPSPTPPAFAAGYHAHAHAHTHTAHSHHHTAHTRTHCKYGSPGPWRVWDLPCLGLTNCPCPLPCLAQRAAPPPLLPAPACTALKLRRGWQRATWTDPFL